MYEQLLAKMRWSTKVAHSVVSFRSTQCPPFMHSRTTQTHSDAHNRCTHTTSVYNIWTDQNDHTNEGTNEWENERTLCVRVIVFMLCCPVRHARAHVLSVWFCVCAMCVLYIENSWLTKNRHGMAVYTFFSLSFLFFFLSFLCRSSLRLLLPLYVSHTACRICVWTDGVCVEQ